MTPEKMDKQQVKGILAVPIRITIDRLDLTAELAPTALGELQEALTIIAPEIGKTEPETETENLIEQSPGATPSGILPTVEWREFMIKCRECHQRICGSSSSECYYRNHNSWTHLCHAHHDSRFLFLDMEPEEEAGS